MNDKDNKGIMSKKNMWKSAVIGHLLLLLMGCANETKTKVTIELGEIINLEYFKTTDFEFHGGTALTVGRVSGGNTTRETYRFYLKDLNGEISLINIKCQDVSFIDGDTNKVYCKMTKDGRHPDDIVRYLRHGIFNGIGGSDVLLITVPIENFDKYIKLQ